MYCWEEARMTVADAIKYLRDTEKITLYDVDQSGWRTGATTKEYIPPVYLTWEVVGLRLDWCDFETPVLELDIKPPAGKEEE
jgi:hypothetical protein